MKVTVIFIFLCYNISLSAQLDTIKIEKVFFNALSDREIDFALKKSIICENLDSNKIEIHHLGLNDSIQVFYKDSVLFDDYFTDMYEILLIITLDINPVDELLLFFKSQKKWARVPIYKSHPKIIIYTSIDVELYNVKNRDYVLYDDKITILYYAWKCSKL